MKIQRKHRTFLIASIVFLNICIDQLSKFLARNQIDNGQTTSLIKDKLLFVRAENTSAALGLGGHLPSSLKIVYLQVLPIAVLIFFFKTIITKTEISKLTVFGLAIAIGGASGNIIDRIVFGSVTDFIQINMGVFKKIIFNMGDISIIFGVLLVLFELSFNKNNNLVDSL